MAPMGKSLFDAQGIQRFAANQAQAKILSGIHERVEHMFGKVGRDKNLPAKLAGERQPLGKNLCVPDMKSLPAVKGKGGIAGVHIADLCQQGAAFWTTNSENRKCRGDVTQSDIFFGQDMALQMQPVTPGSGY